MTAIPMSAWCAGYNSSGRTSISLWKTNIPMTCTVSAVSDLTKGLYNKDTLMQKAIEIQGASEIDVDFDKELKQLVQKGGLLKSEGREVEKLLMNNNPEDGVTGGATLWKLTQGITAFAREQEPERCRELHEISGQLMNWVKTN